MSPGTPRVKVAYLVSRFPTVSETFIVRELDGVAAHHEVDAELFSLFRGSADVLHPATARWSARFRRRGVAASLPFLAYWLARRPLRLLSSIALVVGGHVRRPLRLAKALATVPVAAGIARDLRTLGVDHLHAHWATYPALAAWICRRLTGIPYSFTAHAQDLYVDQSFLGPKAREARFVVAISEYNRRFLAPWDARVEIVRYGIEPGRYRFRPRAPAPAGPVRMLCVATLRDYKGHAVLLDALAGDDPELARVTLDLVGDGPLRPDLEERADRLGLGARVRFLGSRTEEKVAELLDAADAFVLPSIVLPNGWMEGLPNVLIEALAAGVPAIATRMSGIPELIRDGETGLLAEPGDVGGLRAAVLRLLADPEGALARAREGRRVVEEEFDIERSASRLVELFAELPA